MGGSRTPRRGAGDNGGMSDHQIAISPWTRHLWQGADFKRGCRDMWKLSPGVVAWGAVTGVAMVKSGLGMPLAIGLSLFAFAASAQLSAIALLLAGAPVWVIIVTAMCVNLRFVIFSAQMRPLLMGFSKPWRWLAGYLTADITYVLMVQRHGAGPDAGRQETAPLSYFLGLACVNWSCWNVASLAGVLLGEWIPTDWGLAFAGTLALLGLLVTLVKDRIAVLTVGVAAVTAVSTYGVPYKLHIVLAVMAAVAAGMTAQRWQKSRALTGAGTVRSDVREDGTEGELPR